MELKSNVRLLSYLRKLLTGDFKNILPFPVRVQKPVPVHTPCVPLPRCTLDEAEIPAQAVDTFLRTLAENEQIGAHSVLILRHGKVACEAGFAPYSTAYWHVSHSLCKSFTGTAIGMLVDDGVLSLEETVCGIFPEYCNLLTSRRTRSVTVHHLLTMRSGVNFRELGAVLESDWVNAFLSSDVRFDPGSQFEYNSMNSYMLSAIVTRKTGKTLLSFLSERLFVPLGFGNVAWESCPSGYTKGGWGLYVLPEDLAKLGQLYLQRGVWNATGRTVRLLSEDWIARATKADSVHANGEEYGFHVWVHGADGSFLFNGMFGQYVLVLPKLDIVVALNAGSANLFTHGPSWDALQQLLSHITASDNAGFCKSSAATRALQFTLSQLRYATPVPAYGAAPLRLYRGWRALFSEPPAQQEARLVDKCKELAGRAYLFEPARLGLFPIVLSCMNDFYTRGLSRLAFTVEQDRLTLLWTEANMTQRLPVGFLSPAMGSLNFSGNVFLVGTSGQFTTDEDGHHVLKLTVNFVETTSTQRIKLFFLPDGVRVQLNESPSLPFVVQLLMQTNPGFIGKDLMFFRDKEYTRFLFERLCMPEQTGVPEPKTS